MANNNDKKDPKNQSSGDAGKITGEAGKITETIKKILSSGSPTEISKEILTTVLAQALKAKDDVALKVTSEMIGLVRKIDFVKEFSKFAENHKFKITAEVEIFKKDTGYKKDE